MRHSAIPFVTEIDLNNFKHKEALINYVPLSFFSRPAPLSVTKFNFGTNFCDGKWCWTTEESRNLLNFLEARFFAALRMTTLVELIRVSPTDFCLVIV